MAENVAKEKPKLGCKHYGRNCALIAPCCNKKYTCRVCHDEAEKHVMDRHAVQEITCLKCDKQQSVSNQCVDCKCQFADYFCVICRLFDCDTSKQQFHCDKCGICRIGGRENFFHCDKCDVCLARNLGEHTCVEKVSHDVCPICLEDLHTSRSPLHVPKCGHLLHQRCFHEMRKNGTYTCPRCNVSMFDMNRVWEEWDVEVANTEMPDEYKDMTVGILCRDCHKESKVKFHVLGLKCLHCGSYNTAR